MGCCFTKSTKVWRWAHLQTLVDFVKQHPNVHPMGRYGMFKYNNSDHSILTALLSVENILGAKHAVWAVNTETAYHEIRSFGSRGTPSRC